MVKTFEDMVQSVTTSWCMIHHLDNSESVGPNSRRGLESRDTINENHARELLELHTVSPSAGYTQDDVIQLAYIMTGWGHKWSRKNLETGDVWFDQEKHQKGDKQVLGVKYKNDAKRCSFVAVASLRRNCAASSSLRDELGPRALVVHRASLLQHVNVCTPGPVP